MPEETLTLLGDKTALPVSPEEAKLERVPNPNPGEAYLVRFTCPEFTSLCPVTGTVWCPLLSIYCLQSSAIKVLPKAT